jgi:indolepyruvate ferredoxin oxidoreductase
LAEAVARNYFKLLAIKDEYEVARLFLSGTFHAALESRFAGDFKIRVYLAPPLFARRDRDTGHKKKTGYGPWVFTLFRLLAKLKGLRGTVFDIFGYTAERRAEHRLAREYEATVDELLSMLDADNRALAVEIAALPDHIRGFGHVKDKAIEEAKAREAELMAAFRANEPIPSAAE